MVLLSKSFTTAFTCLAYCYILFRCWSYAVQVGRLRSALLVAQQQVEGTKEDDVRYWKKYNVDQGLAQLTTPLSAEETPVVEYAAQQSEVVIAGRIDRVSLSVLQGWVCAKGHAELKIQVSAYIDGRLYRTLTPGEPAPSDAVVAVCRGQGSELRGGTGREAWPVGFRLDLPPLEPSVHEVRMFALHPSEGYRVEVQESPAQYVEVRDAPRLELVFRRKDEIISARNAQVVRLYDELKSGKPWRQVTGRNASEDKPPALLAFVGVFSSRVRGAERAIIRSTWLKDAKGLEQELGVAVRFIIGTQAVQSHLEEELQKEMAEHDDILVVPASDEFGSAPDKTHAFFQEIPPTYDAAFYFKATANAVVNLTRLADDLEERRNAGNQYLGCFKAGQVVEVKKELFYEPEHWRFGEAAGRDGRKNYMRHAQSLFIGVSQNVALYLAQNAPVLKKYAHDDVSMGSWMLGLDVEYVDQGKFCCDTATACSKPECVVVDAGRACNSVLCDDPGYKYRKATDCST